jgi:hypothetical protein
MVIDSAIMIEAAKPMYCKMSKSIKSLFVMFPLFKFQKQKGKNQINSNNEKSTLKTQQV